jgi:hypothetical protein
LALSPCPYCHQFASELVRRRELDREQDELKDQRRGPWSIRAAVLTFIPFLAAAIYDRSGWLLAVSVLAAIFAGAVTLIGLSQTRGAAQMTQPPSVQFFGESGAVLYRENIGPQPMPIPPPVGRGVRARAPSALAIVIAVVSTVGLFAAGMMWIRTFKLLHVVNTDGVEMEVWVDGKPRPTIPRAPTEPSLDAPAAHYILRPGSHSVRVSTAKGEVPERTFDIVMSTTDFVYAPHAAANGECVLLETAVYGGSKSDRGSLVHAPEELWELPTHPDPEYVWKALPDSMELKNNETKRVTALRLTPCLHRP